MALSFPTQINLDIIWLLRCSLKFDNSKSQIIPIQVDYNVLGFCPSVVISFPRCVHGCHKSPIMFHIHCWTGGIFYNRYFRRKRMNIDCKNYHQEDDPS
mmetsp:Transcript_17536/g.35693  ORF Transcript_17536/g.35693 Transcript_17536/m.35693 type:complete len:99 (-) Transcript_17536:282-578(-)